MRPPNAHRRRVSQGCETRAGDPPVLVLAQVIDEEVISTDEEDARGEARDKRTVHGQLEVQHLIDGLTVRDGGKHLSQDGGAGHALTPAASMDQQDLEVVERVSVHRVKELQGRQSGASIACFINTMDSCY